ncbi:MAG TPA: hypothetical protein VH478_06030 [Trebonia sp.]|jgi:hypothetical protein|nr:hypothetical protein [Trebonia sp.]
MADTVGDQLRSLLGADVYTQKGRMRADDLLVRERACQSLGDACARIRKLSSQWRAERVPPSTREQPFPPAGVMEPLRRADRVARAIDDAATDVRGLPLLGPDKVWDRVRTVGLADLLQFDWTLVGEADALADAAAAAADLAALDVAALEEHLGKLRSVVADRRQYARILG